MDVPWLAAHKLAQLVAGVALPKVTLPSVEFPVLQLKQVPSAQNPAKADYQALAALRLKTLALHARPRTVFVSSIDFKASEKSPKPVQCKV